MPDDKDLSALLREWQPTPEPGPAFNRGVWSKIEAAELRRSPFERVLLWLELFESPRVATMALTVALLGGVVLGRFHARASHQERYLDSLKLFAAVSNVH
jgi:hypothetical protein